MVGTGNVGKLLAHSLRSLPRPPPVTLLFHRAKLFFDWKESSKEIKIETNGITVAKSGFDVEVSRPGFRWHGKSVDIFDFYADPEDEALPPHLRLKKAQDAPFPDEDITDPIHNLIVTVKAAQTVGALLPLRHRLGPESSIFFCQNGMGIIDQVNEHVFPDPSARPTYLIGVNSHGVNSTPAVPFSARHAGMGTIAIGILPREDMDPESKSRNVCSPSSRYLLRTVCRVPVLAAIGKSPTEILQAQLEKLAINAIINPLTALVDARNGAMLSNFPITRTMRLLLAEISLVISAMPELKGLPNVSTRFSTERLENLTRSVAYKTSNNISSMLADVREGRQTEIDYINGYIVKRGEELGITCFMNYMIQQLVLGKEIVVSREYNEELPLAGALKNSNMSWKQDRQRDGTSGR